LVKTGAFREDLFFRLSVVPIWLPPLRERREDIPALTDHFLRRYFAGRHGEVPPVSAVVRQAFEHYGWPGNVRELENACERIAQTCTCSMVRVGCLPASLLFQSGDAVHAAAGRQGPPAPSRVSLDARLEEVEAHLIGWALDVSHGNKSRAADLLRIKRSTLGDRIRRLGLDRHAHDAEPEHGHEHEPGHEPDHR
jgi:DNA-binding NtrC family response regulator